LFSAALNGHSDAIAELLLCGADGAVQSNLNGSRCAAPHSRTETAQPRMCRCTPKQWAERWEKLAEYEAGESQVHSALLPAPALSPLFLVPRPSPRCGEAGAYLEARRRL
jgi:hypothetical protein